MLSAVDVVLPIDVCVAGAIGVNCSRCYASLLMFMSIILSESCTNSQDVDGGRQNVFSVAAGVGEQRVHLCQHTAGLIGDTSGLICTNLSAEIHSVVVRNNFAHSVPNTLSSDGCPSDGRAERPVQAPRSKDSPA